MEPLIDLTETYKISCNNIPQELYHDKALIREYFNQFGRVKRLTLKRKHFACTVEYYDEESYENALHYAGEYKGELFEVSICKKTTSRKKDPDPDFLDDPDVASELATMGGLTGIRKEYNLRPEKMVVDASDDTKPKLKRAWNIEPKTPKKKKPVAEQPIHFTSDQLELFNLIKQQGNTVEERYRILDARDKLLRVLQKRQKALKANATKGTCPDMCPEKERLMREFQHQVAQYEQEEGGRGMNAALAVKQYSRSSADQESPLPHELRPVSVLKMTMGYLLHEILDLCDSPDVNLAEWFHFLWDRTRGIRKDITQQELCSQGSVELVEQCARFHIHCSARLVAEDASVFDQKINTENLTKCLQTLKYMYHDLQLKGECCPNEAEFRGYIILLNLHDGNFMWEVQQLREEIQQSVQVKFALEVYSAMDKKNFVKFFKLVHATSYLNACVLMRYFVQVRVSALHILLKCFSPPSSRSGTKSLYPLKELTRTLAFEDEPSAIEFLESFELMLNPERTHLVLSKRNFTPLEVPYALDRSINVVECKMLGSVGEVVCGGPLPEKTFLNHVPQNSFDSSRYLKYDERLQRIECAPSGSAEAEPTTPDVIVIEDEPGTSKSATEIPTSIFTPSNSSDSFAKLESISRPSTSIFGMPLKTVDVPDGGQNLWAPPVQKQPPFIFDLKMPEARQDEPTLEELKLKEKHLLEELAEEERRIAQEERRVAVEAENRRVADEQNRRNEEIRRIELIENQRVEEQRQRRMAERRVKEMEKQKILNALLKRLEQEEEELRLKKVAEAKQVIEDAKKALSKISMDVTDVMEKLLEDVVVKVRDEKLVVLRNIQQKRILSKWLNKWRQNLAKNKRKRKAIDCSPVFVSAKTANEEADELHMAHQDITLKYMKRYKRGKSFELVTVEDEEITKINLFQLTHSILNNRLFELHQRLVKNIFWKVTISLPNSKEMQNGLNRIEETLEKYLQWKERNGDIALIEQIKPNGSQSITYSINKQINASNQDSSNALIFIADNFNVDLQRRILENLKHVGIFTKIPIVLILQECNETCRKKLKTLSDEKILTDYVVLADQFTPVNIMALIQQGLIFLAKKVEKMPPLELDTLKEFLTKTLCTEVWKKANSLTKWNSAYKSCLRSPNVVIGLFNEALAKLKKIIFNESCLEFPSFPEVFKDFLPSEIPDFLPCNYRYFPKFWRSPVYAGRIQKLLDQLQLPLWSEQWPPTNEFDLELGVSKYCAKLFHEPDKPFYKVMSVILRNVDPNENFEDVENVLWTNVVEIIGLEKLNELNFSLNTLKDFNNKSIFNQFFVIYNTDDLKAYNKSDWFYINNPIVKEEMKQVGTRTVAPIEVKEDEYEDIYVDFDLDKMLNEVTSQLMNRENARSMRKELDEFNLLMGDLEESIKIHRRISTRFEDTLKQIIEEK